MVWIDFAASLPAMDEDYIEDEDALDAVESEDDDPESDETADDAAELEDEVVADLFVHGLKN